MLKRVVFECQHPDGAVGRLGAAVQYEEGWKFYPNMSGRHPSRKYHLTMKGCLPRWLNYPDGCQSREEVAS